MWSDDVEGFEPFGAVLLVLLLLMGTLFALKHKGLLSFVPATKRTAGIREMQVEERLSLGPQQSLHLVKICGAKYVVAIAPGACTMQALPDADGSR